MLATMEDAHQSAESRLFGFVPYRKYSILMLFRNLIILAYISFVSMSPSTKDGLYILGLRGLYTLWIRERRKLR